MLLRGRRTSAANRRSFPLSETGWFVSPAWYAASHNSGRTLSASWAAPARTFSGSARFCIRWPPYRPDTRDRDIYGNYAG